MGNVTTIGLDIAKNVLQLHGVDADGAVVVRQRLTRVRTGGSGGGVEPFNAVPIAG